MAARIQVHCTFGLRSIILELAEPFRRARGHGIDFHFDSTPGVVGRMERGEPADLILVARAIAVDLAARGHLPAAGIHDVTSSNIGVAIRAGAPRADISTPAAFKAFLLAQRSVVYTDPASGGASGVHFATVLERLGIAAEMAPKSILNVGSYNSDLVVRGRADVAIQQIAEILPVAGVELLGPLPGELQLATIFVAALGKQPEAREAAMQLVDYLKSAEAAPIIARNGMEQIAA